MFCDIVTNKLLTVNAQFDASNKNFHTDFCRYDLTQIIKISGWDPQKYVQCECGVIIDNNPETIESHMEGHRTKTCCNCAYCLHSIYRKVDYCNKDIAKRDIRSVSQSEKKPFCIHMRAVENHVIPYQPKIIALDADFTSKMVTEFALNGWKQDNEHTYQKIGLACLKANVRDGVVVSFSCGLDDMRYDSKHNIVYTHTMNTIPETQSFLYRGHDITYGRVYEEIKKLYK